MHIDIKIIPNTDNKLLTFLPIFNTVNQHNMCKLVSDWYCIVQTDVMMQGNSSEEKYFNAFQHHSNIRRIKWNMYIIKTEENVKN